MKLSEPPKSFQSWSPGQPFPRKSFANVFDRNANKLYEAVVDLETKTLESWTQQVDAQPAVFFTEYNLKVVDFLDSRIRPVDTTSGSSSTQRTDLTPLVVQQPDGPSFAVDGRNVSRQGWRFRVDWSPREASSSPTVRFAEPAGDGGFSCGR